MGGPALVRLLFGLESPSGKLSITLPRTVGQVPIYYAHKNTGRPPKPDQRAGVPLGTPLDPTGFTCAHIDVESTPLYPFGFGLSYGAFAYTDLRLSSGRLARGEALDVTARLANRGTHEATEVAQLYVRDLVASVTRPVRQLKGFQRVRLAPGEARDIAFRLTADDLAFVGQDGKPVVEPGSFQLWIGGSSTADLGAEFEVI
jgi:beta-glucosidase